MLPGFFVRYIGARSGLTISFFSFSSFRLPQNLPFQSHFRFFHICLFSFLPSLIWWSLSFSRFYRLACNQRKRSHVKFKRCAFEWLSMTLHFAQLILHVLLLTKELITRSNNLSLSLCVHYIYFQIPICFLIYPS